MMTPSATRGALISANQLVKKYGARTALDHVTFAVEPGCVVGLIGRNGAGKTTVVRAILGLIDCGGGLRVLGRNPFRERTRLMLEASFIADVAVMPGWLKVRQALDFVQGVHPRFQRDRAVQLISRTNISLNDRIGELSKGLKTQVHLALTMAVDARLLVLDEPTLGLDPLVRRSFYELLVNEYLDENRTVVVTTNEVSELEHFLTHVIFLERGRIILASDIASLLSRYSVVEVPTDSIGTARAMGAVFERQILGGSLMYFERVATTEFESLGSVRMPTVAELSIAILGMQP
jgi:ABC-2 type transport system ATP-binding protein